MCGSVFLVKHNNTTIKQAVEDWCEGGESMEAVKRRFGPIEEWDVSEVTDMRELFKGQKEFNENLSRWDVSKVTTMEGTFLRATSFNGDLSGWDVSKVTNMRWTFSCATSFNQKLSGAWSTSRADKKDMFYNCPGSIVSS